jgi:hypothetical protein
MGFFNSLSGNGLIACITLVNAGEIPLLVSLESS